MRVDHSIRQFSAFARLEPPELQYLTEAVAAPRTVHQPGKIINGRSHILLDGWVASQRFMRGGARQLVQLAVPGQPLPAMGFYEEPFVALTQSATVSSSALFAAIERSAAYPNLIAALDLMDMESRFFLNEQVARLGRMSAIERVASFLLEVWHRRRTEGAIIPMPLTQQHIADFLGLSVVHVNRTVKELQRQNLVEWNRREVNLVRLPALKELAMFEAPTFSVRAAADIRSLSPGVYSLPGV